MRIDPLRAVLIVYAAILSGPVPVLLFPGWPSFAIGVVLGGTVGAVVARRIERPEAVLTLPRTGAGITVPLAWLIGAVLHAGTVTAFLLSPFFVGALAALIWLVAVVVATETRKRKRLDAMSTSITFQARLPPAQRRQLRLAVGVLAVFVGIAIVAIAVLDFDVSWSAFIWLPGMIPVWLLLIRNGTARDVAVADIGLVVNESIQDWNKIRGAAVTDEALVVRRTGWFRPRLEFHRDDIETRDAVVEAINERAAGGESGIA